MKLDLVEGYGVYITKRELDDAEDSSRNSPTRLIRNLITIFFPKELLATSSAYGGRINKALDKDILGACLSSLYVMHTIKFITLYYLQGMSNLSMQSPQ